MERKRLSIYLFISLLCVAEISSIIVTESSTKLLTSQASDGAKKDEEKQVEQAEKKTEHHVEKENKGEILKEVHKIENAEKGGKKKIHHSDGHHSSQKKLTGGSRHGAKFLEGAKHKKGNYKRGYREKHHKDELKKHDSFYSDGHRSGSYEVFGQKGSKHALHHVAKNHHSKHKGNRSNDDYRKMRVKLGGQDQSEAKGHKGERRTKSHHRNQSKWVRKGGKKSGKHHKLSVSSSPPPATELKPPVETTTNS